MPKVIKKLNNLTSGEKMVFPINYGQPGWTLGMASPNYSHSAEWDMMRMSSSCNCKRAVWEHMMYMAATLKGSISPKELEAMRAHVQSYMLLSSVTELTPMELVLLELLDCNESNKSFKQ